MGISIIIGGAIVMGTFGMGAVGCVAYSWQRHGIHGLINLACIICSLPLQVYFIGKLMAALSMQLSNMANHSAHSIEDVKLFLGQDIKYIIILLIIWLVFIINRAIMRAKEK